MPSYSMDALSSKERYFMLVNAVIPRPIAWVSSLAPDGTRNLAPYSYCNVASSNPPIVHFTSTGRKDTVRNVEASGEFVLNIVGPRLLEAMNVTSADFPPEEDEFDWAGLSAVPSRKVAAPRVRDAAASLECRVRHIAPMGRGIMVFGDVVLIHVADGAWREGRVDPHLYEVMGRLGGSHYTTVTADSVLKIPRVSWSELQQERA